MNLFTSPQRTLEGLVVWTSVKYIELHWNGMQCLRRLFPIISQVQASISQSLLPKLFTHWLHIALNVHTYLNFFPGLYPLFYVLVCCVIIHITLHNEALSYIPTHIQFFKNLQIFFGILFLVYFFSRQNTVSARKFRFWKKFLWYFYLDYTIFQIILTLDEAVSFYTSVCYAFQFFLLEIPIKMEIGAVQN